MRPATRVLERNSVKHKSSEEVNTMELFSDSRPLETVVEACDLFEVAQEFVVGEDGRMQEGFCTWAWNDVYGVVTALR